MEILGHVANIIEILVFFMVATMFFADRRKIKLADYVDDLPEKHKKASFRVSDLSIDRDVKSACASYGFRVARNEESGKFKVIEVFSK